MSANSSKRCQDLWPGKCTWRLRGGISWGIIELKIERNRCRITLYVLSWSTTESTCMYYLTIMIHKCPDISYPSHWTQRMCGRKVLNHRNHILISNLRIRTKINCYWITIKLLADIQFELSEYPFFMRRIPIDNHITKTGLQNCSIDAMPSIAWPIFSCFHHSENSIFKVSF